MKLKSPVSILFSILLIGTLAFQTGCMMTAQYPSASEIKAPAPIEGNTGKYMCPYTSDDTVCEWVIAGRNAKMASQVGSAVGAYAGQKALEQVPFVGGFLGQKAGNAVGREIAIKSMGGLDAIVEGSDLSFDSVEDLAVFLYATHSDHADYAEVVKLLGELYPEYTQKAYYAIMNAPRIEVPSVVEAEVANPIGG